MKRRRTFCVRVSSPSSASSSLCNNTKRRICDPKVVGGAHVGATGMAIPQSLRRAVLARDRHRCTVPGCRAHGWLELHHLTPLSEGGLHLMENLTTLCGAHHLAHHRGLLRITGRAGIDLKFEQVDALPSWMRGQNAEAGP